jgi:biotin operon repressor
MHKIIIINTRKTNTTSINEELKWIGESLGLFNLRDKNSSCFRIFIVLLKKARRNESISSDEVALLLGLTRGTVVHHLNMLREAGLVLREQGGYILREPTLERLIREVQRDIDRTFSDMLAVAKEIDLKLG